jgi:uncharacterized membrane protein
VGVAVAVTIAFAVAVAATAALTVGVAGGLLDDVQPVVDTRTSHQ